MQPPIIEVIVDDSVGNLSVLLRKKDISKHISPLTFVTRVPKLDFSMLKLLFGEHAEAYDDTGYQTNGNNTKCVPAITLNQEFNSFGSYYFFSLITG